MKRPERFLQRQLEKTEKRRQTLEFLAKLEQKKTTNHGHGRPRRKR